MRKVDGEEGYAQVDRESGVEETCEGTERDWSRSFKEHNGVCAERRLGENGRG